jgi:glycosyltransferase involved in cell wall biosynthesis
MTPPTPRRPRLLVVSQYYRPEIPFITADLAVEMSRDMDVTVITAHPNYPHGRFFNSVTTLRPKRTREDSVTVWRLPIIPYHGNSIGRRAICYLSFTLLATIVAPFVAGRADIVWVYQTPFTSAIAAIWFRIAFGARMIYTCADLWPESLLAAKVARPGLMIRALFAYSRAINRLADVIIAPTRGTLARYQGDGIPLERLRHIPIWMEGIGERITARESRSRPRVIYAGNFGAAQALGTVIRAASKLEREGFEFDLELYGSGSAETELRALADTERATAVRFCGRVSPSEAFRISSQATGQIISLEPSPLFAMTVPSKIAFCLAAGTPIVFGLQGEAADILAHSGAGIGFDAADPASCAAAIRRLLTLPADERARMGDSGRQAYEKMYDRTRLLDRYRAIIQAEVLREARLR